MRQTNQQNTREIQWKVFDTSAANRAVEDRTAGQYALDFHLPPNLEASEPPEARGLARDQVKLMVSDPADDNITHATFHDLPQFLSPGDLLVINTSGTRNASLDVRQADGKPLELHLSTHLPSGLWTVELRLPFDEGALPFLTARLGDRLELPGGGAAVLLAPYLGGLAAPARASAEEIRQRLWIADLRLPIPVDHYLEQYGSPIRYRYLRAAWPSAFYQTVYATETGSAEMPSAGRAFTPELITRLVAIGVQVAPLLLHTGVASLENDEPPYEEYFRVPVETARLVNSAHANRKRVIAVGTTVVRALESVTGPSGETMPGEGWTGLVITPDRGLFAVDGLLTGFHEPKSTHLAMLGALARPEHLRLTYREALQRRYLWHEFGDLHLMIRKTH